MTVEERLKVAQRLHDEALAFLFNSNNLFLNSIAKANWDLALYPSQRPRFLFNTLASNSSAVLEREVKRLPIIPGEESEFNPFFDELSLKDPLGGFMVYLEMPFLRLGNPLLNFTLTDFRLVTGMIINTNIIRLIRNPRFLLFNLVVSMSFTADCIELQDSIKHGKVYRGNLDRIYDCIIERSFIAAKLAIEEFDQKNNGTAFDGLPDGLKARLDSVVTSGPYPDPSSLYLSLGASDN